MSNWFTRKFCKDKCIAGFFCDTCSDRYNCNVLKEVNKNADSNRSRIS